MSEAMTYKLPPLPETEYGLSFYDEGGSHDITESGYTAEQMQAYALAAIEAQASVTQAGTDDLLTCNVKPRPLDYPLSDYHRAMTEGPLNYTWTDKPHRLVYDLIAAVRYYASAPVRKPLSDERVQQIHNETGAGYALIRLVENYIKE